MDFFKFNITDKHNNQSYYGSNFYIEKEEEEMLTFLFITYGFIILFGILGNASLFITIYIQPSGRLRNPILVGLCMADLLVSGVSAPLTLLKITLNHNPWYISELGCKSMYLFQSIPIAASTFSLLMLSFDRYATVKHPRLAQLRQRRILPVTLAIGAWISASLVHIAMLFIYTKINFDKVTHKTTCKLFYTSLKLHFIATTCYTIITFILPALGVVLNYLSVKKKLCALSLTARAAHGELPLPMPILRRPTHMIIVTGMTNGARGVVDTSYDEDGGPEQMFEMKSTTRKSRSLQKHVPLKNPNAKQEPKKPPTVNDAMTDLPLGQTSTLRSRRKLAYMLVTAALIFAGCWTPHIICLLTKELNYSNVCAKSLGDFSLLLGYAHSAFSPLINWALNRNSITISNCIPLACLRSGRKFMRTHLKVPNVPPPSSTNEAQLGPFNPRYIKARPQQMYAEKHSSHLY